MNTHNDVHYQFASFFGEEKLLPYAYLLSKKLNEGHICLDLEEVNKDAEQLVFLKGKELDPHSDLQNLPLVTTENEQKPFVLHNKRLYLHRYFHYETKILEKIRRLMDTGTSVVEARRQLLRDNKELIYKLFPVKDTSGTKTTDWQLIAALTSVLHNFSMITGGPGTGKTTTVSKVIAILLEGTPDLRIAVAAPTGKAAVRLTESFNSADLDITQEVLQKIKNLKTTTIHSLLKYQYNSVNFKHNATNPLECDVLIVDESSMIDVALFAKLLDAVPPKARVILLGDRNQLASVEAGSIFGDLCNCVEADLLPPDQAKFFAELTSLQVKDVDQSPGDSSVLHSLSGHVTELKHSYRFDDTKGIGKLAKAIMEPKERNLEQLIESKGDEHVIIDTEYREDLFETFIEGYALAFQSSEDNFSEQAISNSLDAFNNLRILCALRDGKQGIYAVNKRVEDYLKRKRIIKSSQDFYENRPILITRNMKELNLVNGDIGIIRKGANNKLKAWFQFTELEKDSSGKLVKQVKLRPYSIGYLDQVETVYAMTIHKSQGSEYNEIFTILPQGESIALLTRELLYTAVTRAREKVYVQGSKKLILEAADRNVERASGIANRLMNK